LIGYGITPLSYKKRVSKKLLKNINRLTRQIKGDWIEEGAKLTPYCMGVGEIAYLDARLVFDGDGVKGW
jgi:hypothetical protein